jgi:hypothetical protein
VQVPGALAHIAAGGARVWGLNSSGEIFELDFATLLFNQVPGKLTQISVGPTGVWGIDASHTVHQLNPATQIKSCDTEIRGNEGDQPVAESAGGNGVWGLASSGEIFRLEPSSQTFVEIQGELVTISAGTGGRRLGHKQ